jgi:hypothetical protein
MEELAAMQMGRAGKGLVDVRVQVGGNLSGQFDIEARKKGANVDVLRVARIR